VGNRVGVSFATNQPEFSATASQQGTEVIRLNQDPAIHCQVNHLFWGCGRIELLPKPSIPINLMQEMIQRI
jgi:hypothetical protein